MKVQTILTICFAVLSATPGFAGTHQELLQKYQVQARELYKDFDGFSVARGRELYMREEASSKGLISCSSCHTSDPKGKGRTRAQKLIEPLAPIVNPQRFTNYKHAEKWFRRNCDDVFGRSCTAQEKGDFITYLLSIK
jgi:cytochrome c peroxidase